MEYKLKNYNSTKKRYKDYKEEEFKRLMNRVILIDSYLETLQIDIEKQFYFGVYKTFYIDLNLNTKMGMRLLFQNVNHACRHCNEIFLERIMISPNKHKIECFAVKFYLRHYVRINKIMQKAFTNLKGE